MLSLPPIFQVPLIYVPGLVCISAFIWHYLQDKLNYWGKRGIPQISAFKGLYFTIAQALRRKTLYEVASEQYDLLDGHSYGGSFQLLRPTIILRDPGMVKEWLVKGFSNFHDRGPAPDEEASRLTGNLFALAGDRWRTVRTKLAPAFSTAKLKEMYSTLNGCAKELNDCLQDLCSKTGEAEIDVKDLMARYAMDVIGSCAMGIKCNAIKDPENSEMQRYIRQVFGINWRVSLFVFLSLIHPKLVRLLGLTKRTPELTKYLTLVTKEAMDLKTKAGSTRKDFLQILMNARSAEIEGRIRSGQKEFQSIENDGIVFTENIIASIMATFLSTGLDPITLGVTFSAYELAYHPEIQERIFREIQSAKKESGDEIKFEDLGRLEYLDQVINETLRKYPLAGVLTRVCTEPFKIPDSSVVVEKGVSLLVPTASFQRDKKYFPEPDKFDPDRFSKENIHKIVPGSYLPFGEGPRFCIAYRLALMDIKTMLITLVSSYTVHPCAKTKNHFDFDRRTFALNPKGEVWLRLKRRDL